MKAQSTKEKFGQGDPDRTTLVNIAWVQSMTGLSVSAIHTRGAQGTFPRSLKLEGSRSVRWVASEIHAWIDRQVARRDGTPVAAEQVDAVVE